VLNDKTDRAVGFVDAMGREGPLSSLNPQPGNPSRGRSGFSYHKPWLADGEED